MKSEFFKHLPKEEIELLDKNPVIKHELYKFFKSYGFKSLRTSFTKPLNQFVDKDLTVYNYIKFGELKNIASSSSFTQGLLNNSLFYYCSFQEYKEGQKILSKYSEVPIAIYFKERNILYISFRLLEGVGSLQKEKVYDKLLEELKICFEPIKFKKVNIDDFFEKQSIKLLKSHIDNSINTTKSELIQTEENIKICEGHLLSYNKSRFELVNSIEVYDKISKNFDITIKDSLKEVKELKFVKSVKFVSEGIKFHFGKLSFEGFIDEPEQDDITRKVKCYLGDYTFNLGHNYSIDNKDYLTIGIDKYHHMHKGNSTCWGDYGSEIQKLIVEFKYKQLCMLIYSWLKSYNPNDKIIAFDRYYQARKLEGKFDENGNILKSWKEKPKVVVKEIKVGSIVRIIGSNSNQNSSIGDGIIAGIDNAEYVGEYQFKKIYIFSNGYSNSYSDDELEVIG